MEIYSIHLLRIIKNKYQAIFFLLINYLFILEHIQKYGYISNRIQKINKINFNYIHNLKKVVYTVNLGSYDNIKNITKEIGYDYFLFVDKYDNEYNNSNWTIIFLPEEVNNLNLSLIKKQRFIKTHPHIFFSNYDLSIYMDCSFNIIGNLDEFLLRILTPKHSMYFLEHPKRNKISQEFKRVEILKKDTINNIERVKERYKKKNFPDKSGLIYGCLIIRKHNDKNCIDTMEEWFDEIKYYSHRDQLSFNYVLWKFGRKIKDLSKQFCFQYFKGNNIHRKILIFQ